MYYKSFSFILWEPLIRLCSLQIDIYPPINIDEPTVLAQRVGITETQAKNLYLQCMEHYLILNEFLMITLEGRG